MWSPDGRKYQCFTHHTLDFCSVTGMFLDIKDTVTEEMTITIFTEIIFQQVEGDRQYIQYIKC